VEQFQAAQPAAEAVPELGPELTSLFGSLHPGQPFNQVLDSMGLMILRMVCEDRGLPFQPEGTLEQLQALGQTVPVPAPGRVFSIVALMDGIKLGFKSRWKLVDPAFLAALAQVAGCPVEFEHLVVPPMPVLWSDLIFHDYFMPRQAGPAYSAFAECMGKIKRASLLLVDDEDNFRLPIFCAYPQLDHRFSENGLAGFLGHRFTRYTLKHHLLPRQVVIGAEIKPKRVLEALAALRSYLAKPIMTLAFHDEYRAFTHDWDYREYRSYQNDADYQENPIDLDRTRAAILAFVARHQAACARPQGGTESAFIMKDPPHFCSFLINPKAVQWALSRFASFCIVGLPSSVPFVEKALKLLGKPYFYSPVLNPERDDFECFLLTGASGSPRTSKPVLDLVNAGDGAARPRNLPFEVIKSCPCFMFGTPDQFKQLKPEFMDAVPLGNFYLNGGLVRFPREWFDLDPPSREEMR
jgi:hypothetical protein